MRCIILFFIFFTIGCAPQKLKIPADFAYKEVQTNTFRLSAWVKIKNPSATVKIYIEGDGHAFYASGRATNNPTPIGTLLREIAFNDTSENVIYLARPCQYIKDSYCSTQHWTTARFSKEVINATYQAISQLIEKQEIILIGYSGGAQVAGLLGVIKPLNLKFIATIAGNIDVDTWVKDKNLSPLTHSLSLCLYKKEFLKIPQIHYVGEKDKIIPPYITQNFLQTNKSIIPLPNATHNKGFEIIYPDIWDLK